MKLQKSRVTPIDLKAIDETYPDNSNRRNYFLFFVSSDYRNYDILIKWRPYGGLIGIDNSSLDKHLKNCNILRLHAISHDAAGFVHEFYQQRPTYCSLDQVPF